MVSMLIIRNAAQCAQCNDIIESTHRHDFKYCSCQSIFVDGGTDYIRSGGEPKNFIPLYEMSK